MAKNAFEFELYRLNLVDTVDLFTQALPVLRSDEDIVRVIRHAAQARFDQDIATAVTNYRWSLRGPELFEGRERRMLSVTLARSTLTQHGRVVTEDEIIEGVFDTAPALANTAVLLFDLTRHLVAVERSSQLLRSQTWRKAVEQILELAAKHLEYGSVLVLEPRPEENEVLSAFLSMEKVTRLRVHLRLPNPELNRFTRHLYDDLRRGGIRDYLQDMRNPTGLNKDESALPFASASMAQQGYKAKEVLVEGIEDGRFKRVVTGRRAARGRVQDLRDFVRGLAAATTTKEGRRIVDAITEEIDRIAPPGDEAA